MNQQYCSIDIEASGFDPEKNEILEIAFVFFELKSGKFHITEEWTQVFRPSKPVSSYIYGLTGITPDELENAPRLSELHDFVQEKIGSAALLGHSINSDARFLEANGFRLTGNRIDTLDLVQIMLPTYHSYNLENLMHVFNIQTGRAHRALADCKATLQLLENLLGMYHSLPSDVRGQMSRVARISGLPFAALLDETFLPAEFPKQLHSETDAPARLPEMQIPHKNAIVNVPKGAAMGEVMAAAAHARGSQVLLVVPHERDTMQLWKNRLASPVVPAGQVFDPSKLAALLQRLDLGQEEAKFLLKVLVWQAANWQTASLFDLNVSFAGSHLKALVAGQNAHVPADSAVVCVDLETFLQMVLAGSTAFAQRSLYVQSLLEFEKAVSEGLGRRVSWNYVSYLLKSFYNPELPEVNTQYKEIVTRALEDTDLFFGLAHALLNSLDPGSGRVVITNSVLYAHKYQKVKAAAANFAEKLEAANAELRSDAIADVVLGLTAFFAEDDNVVKWVELSESRCAFFSSQIDIKNTVRDILHKFRDALFFESLPSDRILRYFIDRLGLLDFTLLHADIKLPAGPVSAYGKCQLHEAPLSVEGLAGLITPESLPMAVVFSSVDSLKRFYDQNYSRLQEFAHIFNQASAAGTGRVFKNFSIHGNSLLLTTDKLLLRFLTSRQPARSVPNLEIKRLIMGGLPLVAADHPYEQALLNRHGNPQEDYVLPQVLLNLHQILSFFATEALEQAFLYNIGTGQVDRDLLVDFLKTQFSEVN